ncbi:MAG: DNA-processing protein DprA [Chromatiales bacterium]|jgi:DNA processing protein
MSDNRIEAWLLVSQAPGIGSRTFQRLLSRFDRPENILDAPPQQLQAAGLRQDGIDFLQRADRQSIQPSLAWLEQPDHYLVTLQDPVYPPLLAQIPDPPPLLFVQGQLELLQRPQLAIVGSRNPTPSGIANAKDFSAYLAGAGLTITSGLAVGIDGAAHQGALNRGTSIAVTGTGLDRVYPANHRNLAHELAEQGALVSEYPPGTPPKAENFPRRNRIISGLSVGVLVVEATLHSGSLITARLALEQGREVFAIPGSIHNPQARGCHRLIREGAKLVESAQDIFDELGALFGSLLELPKESGQLPSPATVGLDPEYTQLIEAMGFDPISVDELIVRTGLTPEAVSSMLLLLELDGYVSSAPGGYYCRTAKPDSRMGGREEA